MVLPKPSISATRAELEQLRLLPEAVDSIIARDLHDRAEAEIEAVRKLGGDILILDDGVYPSSVTRDLRSADRSLCERRVV